MVGGLYADDGRFWLEKHILAGKAQLARGGLWVGRFDGYFEIPNEILAKR